MMAGKDFVCYFRVSTDRQGRSGLGLEAQRTGVDSFLSAYKGQCVAEYTEIESGKKNDRPQLGLALAEAKRRNATLLIAKLDRLARNVAFIANLLEAGVEIAAADMPEANRMMMQMMAVFAEQEGRAISERTKAALAATGKPLGFANPVIMKHQKRASQRGGEVMKARLDQHRTQVMPIVDKIRKDGVTTLQGIADALNERGTKSARGGIWYASSVKNMLMLNDS